MGIFDALRYRDFRWLVTGRTAGWLANSAAPIALAFAVLDLTGSVADLGIVVGARSICNVVLLLVGGVLADRLSRAVLLQGASIAAALTQALLALSVLFGFASIPLFVSVGMINGGVAAISFPAAMALTPRTVPSTVLRQANAIARIAANLSRIGGASLGGLCAATLGSGWAMAFAALAFAAESFGFLKVRAAGAVPARARTHVLADLREGWREFRSRTWVWVVVLQFMIVNAVLSGSIYVLGPKIADETVGRGAWGLVLAAQTVGAVVGGLLAAHRLAHRALAVGTALTAVAALPLVTLALVPTVLALAIAMFLTGASIEQFAVAWDLSLQENVPPDRLARVYSYDAFGSIVALPVGQMTAGPIATSAGTAPALIGGGCLIVAATAAAMCSRDVRTLRRRESIQESPIDDPRPTAPAE
jgi:MFS family permease